MQSFLLKNLDLLRILQDLRLDVVLDMLPFATGNPQDQIVQRAASENVDMVP